MTCVWQAGEGVGSGPKRAEAFAEELRKALEKMYDLCASMHKPPARL